MTTLSKYFLIVTAFLALVGGGCVPASLHEKNITSIGRSCSINGCTAGEKDGGDVIHITKLAGSRIDLKNAVSLKPGDNAIIFTLLGEDGRLLGADDLKVEHEKRLHLLIVRDDMTEFQHIHPEFKQGQWIVQTNIPKQGNYQMYIDIAPVRENAVVLRVPFSVGGETLDANAPGPSRDLSTQNGDYVVKLSIDAPVRTKETKPWTFMITKNGQPVDNIGPYLGAYGHIVELRHGDPDDFFHVHPTTEVKPVDGNVVFMGTFPTKGRYTLYAQFNLGNQIKTFPITLDVQEDGTASSDSGIKTKSPHTMH